MQSVLAQLRVQDGTNPLVLAVNGLDTSHNRTYIPIFVASSERISAELVYSIAIIDTHSEAHKDRRKQELPPVWEIFKYRDVRGAAVFAFGFLAYRRVNHVMAVRAIAKERLIGPGNCLLVEKLSIYSAGTTPLARIDTLTVDSMESALRSLDVCS